MNSPLLEAASRGGLVWAGYGLAETFLIGVVPWLSQAVVAPLGSQFVRPHAVVPISPGLTAVVLVVYPLAGALLTAAIDGPIDWAARRRGRSNGVDRTRRRDAVATLALCVCFALNAALQAQATVLPACLVPCALASALLASAWRPEWRKCLTVSAHPLAIVGILVGASFMGQPRPHLTMAVQAALGMGSTAVAVLVASVAGRAWNGSAVVRRVAGRLAPASGQRPAWTAALAASVLVLAVSSLAGAPRSPLGAPGPRIPSSGRPNVVLIVLDTVRADHLSVYGYARDTTPNLRRLAASGATLYLNAIAASNSTLGSHASIFTGQSPRRHGAHISPFSPVGIPLAPASVTLAQLLADRGYLTGGIVSNTAFLDPVFGLARGFAHYDSRWFVHIFMPNRPYLLREAVRQVAALMAPRRATDALFADARSVTDRASAFLDAAAASNRPFLLFLNYMDAHQPYLPPPPYDRRYPGRDDRFRWSRYGDLVREVTTTRARPLTAREFDHLTSQYDGSIAYLDDQLARLFRRLKASGQYDNSLIIVTSDHGEAFGEASIVGHAMSVYQHQVRVPLLVKFPGRQASQAVDGPVGAVDLLPTILDVVDGSSEAAVPDRGRLEGVGLGRAAAPPGGCRVVAESYSPRGPGWTSGDAGPAEVALFCGRSKLVVGAGGGIELFDLASDPSERASRPPAGPLPASWAAMVARVFEEGRAQSRGAAAVDGEVRDRLRSLGYVQ